MRADATSYRAETEMRGVESEIERLRAQVLLSWDAEERALRRLGLRDGMEVLELGCGPGLVRTSFAPDTGEAPPSPGKG